MSEKKTLSMLFRELFKKYVHKSDPVDNYDQLMKKLDYVRMYGKKFTREEMNER